MFMNFFTITAQSEEEAEEFLLRVELAHDGTTLSIDFQIFLSSSPVLVVQQLQIVQRINICQNYICDKMRRAERCRNVASHKKGAQGKRAI